eukprot:CAMPEP_0204406744 /NCGR_PEP_ID=MMETSP0470-20130426/8276_1 /ASSEMBLY_ACC=CAM_ASM_000385 /TAXON_ID=2969 /ORGANISM="Oxyrrhis marina" /LENGTH=163 /DNA_ID=CAMNT_0051402343 /DNA_START=1 /DNA_END=493 /DNA_ORIENTATION=-
MKLTRSPAVRDALVSVIQVIKALLESRKPSWQLAELAAMCTFPGDPGQPVHADTSHIYDEQVVTIFVALHDIDITRGPTKMYPGSHVDGELHMGYRKPDEDAAVYCTMRKGDCAVMEAGSCTVARPTAPACTDSSSIPLGGRLFAARVALPTPSWAGTRTSFS